MGKLDLPFCLFICLTATVCEIVYIISFMASPFGYIQVLILFFTSNRHYSPSVQKQLGNGGADAGLTGYAHRFLKPGSQNGARVSRPLRSQA